MIYLELLLDINRYFILFASISGSELTPLYSISNRAQILLGLCFYFLTLILFCESPSV